MDTPKNNFNEQAAAPEPEGFGKLEAAFEIIGRREAKLEMLKTFKRTGVIPKASIPMYDDFIADEARLIQDYLAQNPFDEWFAQAAQEEAEGALDGTQSAALREMRKDYALKTALPDDMAIKARLIESDGRSIHADAQSAVPPDWETAKEWLRKVIAHQQQAGQLYADALGLDMALDGMLALWSPGLSAAEVDEYFEALRQELAPLIEQARQEQAAQTAPQELQGPFDADKQKELNRLIAATMGMDMSRGGLYYSANASIEGGTRNDARANVTEPKAVAPFYVSLKSAIHEGWHEIYRQNLPEDLIYAPLGQVLGGVMDEAVALLGDMVIGRTPEFSDFIAQQAAEIFGTPVDGDQLYRLRSHLHETTDRKNADELTYHLHVMARWQAYKELFEGTVSVDDYPQRLAELYKDYLDMDIEDPQALALSDVHLFVGKGALYPSYTIGHGIAAQLWHKMREDIADIEDKIGAGDFAEIREWLADNICTQGRRYELAELIEKATGLPPDPQYQVAHLKERFTGEEPDEGTAKPAPPPRAPLP